jgi:palmitoyl-protein thioesterase
VVVPREGEWWGHYSDDYKSIVPMKQTQWYTNDLFGLKTADENGKIFFNSTDGNHLDFTDEQLYGWLDIYCS